MSNTERVVVLSAALVRAAEALENWADVAYGMDEYEDASMLWTEARLAREALSEAGS